MNDDLNQPFISDLGRQYAAAKTEVERLRAVVRALRNLRRREALADIELRDGGGWTWQREQRAEAEYEAETERMCGGKS